MKTKIYFRLNIGWQLFALFFLGCAIYCLYAIVEGLLLKNYKMLWMIVVFIVIMYIFLELEHNCIIFKERYIYAPDDWLWAMDRKIQYKTIVKYEEIESVNIISNYENSSGKEVLTIIPITHLEFNCKNGKVKRIFITYFTKRQRAKILNEIQQRMDIVKNLRN